MKNEYGGEIPKHLHLSLSLSLSFSPAGRPTFFTGAVSTGN
jgi:hypothetical protein